MLQYLPFNKLSGDARGWPSLALVIIIPHSAMLCYPLASPEKWTAFAMTICRSKGGVVTWTQNTDKT
eukprot:7727846-Karenia_brevis.AAC.1